MFNIQIDPGNNSRCDCGHSCPMYEAEHVLLPPVIHPLLGDHLPPPPPHQLQRQLPDLLRGGHQVPSVHQETGDV